MGILSRLRERKKEVQVEEVKVAEKLEKEELIMEIKEGFDDAIVKFMSAKTPEELFAMYGIMLKGLWEYTRNVPRKELKSVLKKAGFVELFLKVGDILEKKG